MNFILNKFKLVNETEEQQNVVENITKGATFSGTNLWLLIFAIFIASLGLNVNSPSVVIGAMLISPLMGPVIALGLGMSTNNLSLVKIALSNYAFAMIVALTSSTIYFLITPLNSAHSEILAQTSPTIYDVFIALMGGSAGFLALSSKLKGNVLIGMSIATALMPPLCTAGYGLANLKFDYFFGAFYLFIINTVFISLAALITSRILKFPKKRGELKTKYIIAIIVVITIIPSIYFAYDIVKQDEYHKSAEQFISTEAVFENDFLLNKKIDSKNKVIQLTFGGEKIDSISIEKLKGKLSYYKLNETKLQVNQGFTYNSIGPNEELLRQIEINFNKKDNIIKDYKTKLDSVNEKENDHNQLFLELKVQYSNIKSFSLQNVNEFSDSTSNKKWVSIIKYDERLSNITKEKIQNWMKVRTKLDTIEFHYLK